MSPDALYRFPSRSGCGQLGKIKEEGEEGGRIATSAYEGGAQPVRDAACRAAAKGVVGNPDALPGLSTLPPVLARQPVQTLAIFEPRRRVVKGCSGRRAFPKLAGLPVRSRPKPADRRATGKGCLACGAIGRHTILVAGKDPCGRARVLLRGRTSLAGQGGRQEHPPAQNVAKSGCERR